MILLLAVVIGLLASLTRLWLGRRRLALPRLHLIWLVPVAFVPQLLIFYLPATYGAYSEKIAAIGLISSQVLLLTFAWFNRQQPGFWALTLGLMLNLLVITLNGGLMPISPEMVHRLGVSAEFWQVGSRLGDSKDIVLPIVETRLWLLSDRFLLPLPAYKVAFSLGDVFISMGAFWLMWTLSNNKHDKKETTIEIIPVQAR